MDGGIIASSDLYLCPHFIKYRCRSISALPPFFVGVSISILALTSFLNDMSDVYGSDIKILGYLYILLRGFIFFFLAFEYLEW